MKDYAADDLRFVSGTHTTLRRLDVLSQLIQIIGSSHLPEEVLKLKAEYWSKKLIASSNTYASLNGKLTTAENGKPTVAFKHYVSLLEGLGLVLRLGQTLSLTKMGYLLARYAKNKSPLDYLLSLEERMYYRYLLFSKDADMLLCSLSLAQRELNQKQIQEAFEKAFIDRLSAKAELASGEVKSRIAEQKRIIQVEWRNPQKYAEHIAVPRLEWLSQLGFLQVSKKAGNTRYELSEAGSKFVMDLPVLEACNQVDIDNEWITAQAFSAFAKLETELKHRPFVILSKNEQDHCLRQAILDAFAQFNSGNAMRMGVIPALPFICIQLLVECNVVSDIKTIVSRLENVFIANNKSFSYRPAARISEGYILAKIHIT